MQLFGYKWDETEYLAIYSHIHRSPELEKQTSNERVYNI